MTDWFPMKALRVVSLLVGLTYLCWRAVFTWEDTNLALFVALLIAEAYGIMRSAIELCIRFCRRTAGEGAS